MTTKTITLDFGTTDVTATVTLVDELPAADWMAVVIDDVPAREAGDSGWWWEDMDPAARMWDFR